MHIIAHMIQIVHNLWDSSQPLREWFKLGFVYSIHINTNMVKIIWVGLEQASQYVNNCNYILCYGSGNYSALPTKRSHLLDPNRWWKYIISFRLAPWQDYGGVYRQVCLRVKLPTSTLAKRKEMQATNR